ncbi:hypothetical protein HDU76_006098 [Blyttiomyces sp. JEL0837]|nr:hypothetical protein HDU76_006098 [Blyttiomyces sp. JEL0837]
MVNYDKWNKLDDYSSDEDDKNSAPRLGGGASVDLPPAKAKLITVPWDPYCEEIRWALARHGTPYVEHPYPWGLHLWATLAYSDPIPHAQQTRVPIYETESNDTYKRSPTDIYMYIFAHSFHSRIRVYGITTALELQNTYDTKLGPAVISVFLSTVLSKTSLTEKYIFSTIHLHTWSTIQRLVWPFLRFAMHRYYDLTSKGVEKAWQTIETIFDEVGAELAKDGGRSYIAGNMLTAADMSFCSHAAFVLFLNEKDDTTLTSTHLTMALPSLKELPKHVVERVKKLRQTPAGKHVVRMYRKERIPADKPDGFRSLPSKFAKENNPWWTKDEGRLIIDITHAAAPGLIFAIVIIAALLPWYFTLVGFIVTGVVLGLSYWRFAKGSVFDQRVKQILFILRGKFEPTERDIVEKAQEDKDKAEAEAKAEGDDKVKDDGEVGKKKIGETKDSAVDVSKSQPRAERPVEAAQ